MLKITTLSLLIALAGMNFSYAEHHDEEQDVEEVTAHHDMQEEHTEEADHHEETHEEAAE